MDLAREPKEDDFLQAREELEALTSIYGDDFRLVSPVDGESCGNVDVKLISEADIILNIVIPPGYPSRDPPRFSLLAPFLRGKPRQLIEAELSAVIDHNRNQSVLYQLIEKARQLVSDPDVLGILTRRVETQHVPSEKAESVIREDQNDVPCPEILHGEPFTERKSTFQGHVAQVNSADEVRAVMKELLRNRKIAEATHNVMAYRIRGKGDVVISDCCDDGEDQAGGRLLHLLNIKDATNVVVVVSRWFGGVLLGPERFKHINNAAGNVLAQLTKSVA